MNITVTWIPDSTGETCWADECDNVWVATLTFGCMNEHVNKIRACQHHVDMALAAHHRCMSVHGKVCGAIQNVQVERPS